MDPDSERVHILSNFHYKAIVHTLPGRQALFICPWFMIERSGVEAVLDKGRQDAFVFGSGRPAQCLDPGKLSGMKQTQRLHGFSGY